MRAVFLALSVLALGAFETARAAQPADEPAPHHLTRALTVYPQGAEVPKGFLDQAKGSDLGGHSTCFADWEDEAKCDVYVLDIYGDGARELLMAAPEDQNDHYLAMEIFKQQPGGAWAKSGELLVTCASSIQALRRGDFSFAPPKARDIVVAGRQFNILSDPDFGCPELGGKRPGPAYLDDNQGSEAALLGALKDGPSEKSPPPHP